MSANEDPVVSVVVTTTGGRRYGVLVNDKVLVRVAAEFRAGILGDRSSTMMCAAVSWALQGYLSALGIETKAEEVVLKEEHRNHVFLKLEDGRVLDATADQFSSAGEVFPPVYLGPPLRIHAKGR